MHRVFSSSYFYYASSRRIQFRWIYSGDSRQVVTPFMQATSEVAKNFATLGSSELGPPFTETYFRNTIFLHFVFLHRAGVRPYTSSYDFAKSCGFDNQSQVSFCVTLLKVLLLPKLRSNFAEFLQNSYSMA